MADRQFKCQNCTKSFSSSHQLAQHVRIHTSEKPYKCSVCEKSFKQLSHVQQHTRLHTGERPYKCSDLNCGRAFTQLSNLQQHMKTHQNGVDKSERTEKRYVNSSSCPICGKTYVNEGSLKKHIQTTHADVINNSFNDINIQPNSSPLNSIVQINYNLIVNNGTFSCSACNETFETKPDLLQHLEQMKSDSRHQYSSAEILLNAASIRPQNAIQMTNNSANNLLIINNQNNAFLELTSRVLNNRSNTSKKR